MKRGILYHFSHPLNTISAILFKLSDKYAIKKQWEKLGREYPLNFNHPKTLSEKIAWLKLHDRKSLYTTLVDKHRAKLWLKEKFGDEHIIPTIKTYSIAEDILLDELPASFVLKCNHDSGNVYLCFDKNSGNYFDKHMQPFNFEQVKELLQTGLSHNFYYNFREWPYKNVPPCIVCEMLMLLKDGTLPNDFKLFFINGEFQFTYVSYGRGGVEDRCTYDKDWKRLPFVYVQKYAYREDINTADVPRPESYDDMLRYGQQIASYFKFVRIDFYDIDGKAYFGEITPFHCAGEAFFYPEEYDLIYGQKLKLK